MSARFIVALAVAITAAPVAHAADVTYRNPRFGTVLTIPGDVFDTPEPASENGDGQSWTSADGAWLGVWGWYNALDFDAESLLEFSAGNHRDITYRASGPDWAVLSGYDEDGRVFYERNEFGADGALHTMLVRYPPDLKPKYDPLVARLADSLAGP
ncbi:MAG: hypothetical protein WAT70_08625 [Rhizobiaceae bacterium]